MTQREMSLKNVSHNVQSKGKTLQRSAAIQIVRLNR